MHFQAFPARYNCGKIHIYIQYILYIQFTDYFTQRWFRCYCARNDKLCLMPWFVFLVLKPTLIQTATSRHVMFVRLSLFHQREYIKKGWQITRALSDKQGLSTVVFILCERQLGSLRLIRFVSQKRKLLVRYWFIIWISNYSFKHPFFKIPPLFKPWKHHIKIQEFLGCPGTIQTLGTQLRNNKSVYDLSWEEH